MSWLMILSSQHQQIKLALFYILVPASGCYMNKVIPLLALLTAVAVIPIASAQVSSSSNYAPPDCRVCVPDWIKNNAGWWANGAIDDNTFVSGIQYLIKNGIIVVQAVFVYFTLRSSSKKNFSPNAGSRSSSHIAFSSYFAKNGMPTHFGFLPCNNWNIITF